MRRRALWALLILAVLLGGVGAWLVSSRDRATRPDAALLAVSEIGSAPGETGVYRYLTTGFEEVDAFSGARHEYPAETYLVITAGACGPVVRWVALDERWVEWEHCGSGGAITVTRSKHEWFGVGDLEVESCPVPMPLLPETAMTIECVAGDTTETYLLTPGGEDSVEVAGTAVAVQRVTVTSELAGGSTGTSGVELWVMPGTLLVVRAEVERHTSTASPLGDIGYVEEYTLVLASLFPGEAP